MSSVRYELHRMGRLRDVVSIQSISSGVIADAWLVEYQDGSNLVAKTSFGVPADYFSVERAGLDVLGATGCVRTPSVFGVSEHMLLLEASGSREDSRAAWEALAHDLAALHRNSVHERFGWGGDGYLGWLPQHNTWTDDGHTFFAEQRLLRYLSEPLAEKALESADRHALERLCARLPEVIPRMPSVMTHGDLWSSNVVGGADGRLVLIDPAVSCTWAEVDLSMLWCEPRPPESEHFFARYQELNPSPPGWVERMSLLHLREILSVISHFGGPESAVDRLRQILAPFYTGHRQAVRAVSNVEESTYG